MISNNTTEPTATPPCANSSLRLGKWFFQGYGNVMTDPATRPFSTNNLRQPDNSCNYPQLRITKEHSPLRRPASNSLPHSKHPSHPAGLSGASALQKWWLWRRNLRCGKCWCGNPELRYGVVGGSNAGSFFGGVVGKVVGNSWGAGERRVEFGGVYVVREGLSISVIETFVSCDVCTDPAFLISQPGIFVRTFSLTSFRSVSETENLW